MAKQLTVASVEKIKPDPARRLEIPDGLLPGLYLVVQPSGRKSWAVRYRYAGEPCKLTLDGFVGLQEAREEARKALADIQKGPSNPAREKKAGRKLARERGEADHDRFDAVARVFLERYAKPKNRSWLETARLLGLRPDRAKPEEAENPKSFVAIKDGLAERWGDRRIEDIARRDVIEALDEAVDRGSPIVANRMLAALRKLFGWATDRGILSANPATGVKAPSPELHRDRVLSDDELRAVWMAAEEIGWPFGRIVQLLILTDQRRDEVGEVRWSEVDFAHEVWTLPRERIKTDAVHEVPLSSLALAHLAAYPRVKGRTGYVFSLTGERPVSGFSKAKERLDRLALAALRRRAGERGARPDEVTLAPWRLHDIRRTVASGMARLGINLPVIEKVLNHTSGTFAGVVGVYQRHSFADEKRKALEAWGGFVERLVAEEPAGKVVALRV